MRFVFSLSLVLLTACAVNESQIFVDAGPDQGAVDLGRLGYFDTGPAAYFRVVSSMPCPMSEPAVPPAPYVRWLDMCMFSLAVIDEGSATDPASLSEGVVAPCKIFDAAGVLPADWFLVLATAPEGVHASCGDLMFLASELRPNLIAETFTTQQALQYLRGHGPPWPGPPPVYSFDYEHNGFVPIATTEPLP